jgi:hypothetical protein
MATLPTFAERYGPYDEINMIGLTVIRYHRYLLTLPENDQWLCFLARAKSRAYDNPTVETRIRESAHIVDSVEIRAVLAEGYPTFLRKVGARIQRDCLTELAPNRCPECSKIVLTPWARWCMWCQHDWHPPAAVQSGV